MNSNNIRIVSEENCTGCMMCKDVCTRNAISFKVKNGFWFPNVNLDICVNCGLCIAKCPIMKDIISTDSLLECYGAKSKDENIRWNSTSGGFFFELANQVVTEKGFCAGAIYSHNNEIVHAIGNDIPFVHKLMQSKYAQSNTEGIYKQVKMKLNSGNLVLFCGCPCQVEALISYLGKNFDNLLTLDFVCLGICSPVVYRKYLDLMESKYNSKITKVWFKNKKEGWRSIGVRIDFANGKTYFRKGNRDLFMVAFTLDTLSIRKSCDFCKFRKIPHSSDLTIADFWGIENVKPEIDDDLGLSAVFVNTEKGKIWFDKISGNLVSFQTTSDKITAGNFSTLSSKRPGANRDVFLRSIESLPLDVAIEKYGTAYSGWNRLKLDAYTYAHHFKQLICKALYGKS